MNKFWDQKKYTESSISRRERNETYHLQKFVESLLLIMLNSWILSSLMEIEGLSDTNVGTLR